jgi:hypothetical protein
MNSDLLERVTFALLPTLRIWDGDKIRIPVNTVGVFAAVHHYTTKNIKEPTIEVGHISKSKVAVTLVCSEDQTYGDRLNMLIDSFAQTARDGTVAVLAQLTWLGSNFVREPRCVGTPKENPTHPKVLVVPGTKLGWFCWHRDNAHGHGPWQYLDLVKGDIAQTIAKERRT